MKRRSVRNDPINTPERDRGAVVVNFAVNMDTAVPAAQSTPPGSTGTSTTPAAEK
ncbi:MULTISPECIES: hypothetical protein [Actinoalloteichus]|uniref:Uncharacterized protein n=1 Tax=Actinoalloteichus fjordicus TaxID=1612552 RepID=A0AAC9PTD6_9PSEU|nr:MULTISPECIES: hypothetical protein [Actinoalloteichus]APU15950.1 hypothetical protein UA74_19625 [Actinoalloteichus fjordicus]APU22013.1 hypothetical protein UA75_20120 [Actinoalloteichus sp. GBA129-24]